MISTKIKILSTKREDLSYPCGNHVEGRRPFGYISLEIDKKVEMRKQEEREFVRKTVKT